MEGTINLAYYVDYCHVVAYMYFFASWSAIDADIALEFDRERIWEI